MSTGTDWSVIRKPRWIGATVVAVGFAVMFVLLALWQLDRLDERRTLNATIESRLAEPARPLVGLMGEFGEDATDLSYRRAIAEGTYRPNQEFVSIGRVYGDVSGTLVATPLDVGGGDVLIVVRGLVPSSTPAPPAVGYEVPIGPVVVTGRIDDGEASSRIAEQDPPGGELTSLNRIDLAFIDRWIEGEVLPFTLLLDEQRPAGPANQPVTVPDDELTEGSHLGYAVQWFAFAAIALVGLVALLFRAARSATSDGT